MGISICDGLKRFQKKKGAQTIREHGVSLVEKKQYIFFLDKMRGNEKNKVIKKTSKGQAWGWEIKKQLEIESGGRSDSD